MGIPDGEKNVFHTFYDEDLDSDLESGDEALQSPPPKRTTPSPKLSHAEKVEMLRRVARKNKEVSCTFPPIIATLGSSYQTPLGDESDDDMDLDVDLGYTRTASPDGDDGAGTQQDEESQYSISRLKRTSTVMSESVSVLSCHSKVIKADGT